MTALTRKFKKIFAKDASNNGVFGSAAALNPQTSNNPETIESLSAFLNGWNDATLGGLHLPTVEDLQALKYDTDYHLAYFYQEGIPEYNSLTEYQQYSIVKKTGTTELYKSLADLNTGNPLTDVTKWILCGDLLNLSKAVPATATSLGTSYLSQPITIANNSSAPNTDIDFSAGNFQFSDGSGQAIASAMTKRLQSSGAWSAGNNGNGLFSGARANNTWYYAFAIYNPTTGVSDFGFCPSSLNVASVLPSGFTKFSRRGSIKTDGSGNIIAFTQTGNYFEWKTPIKDYDEATYTTATSKTISTPPNTIAKMMQFFDSNASGSNVYGYISNLSSNDIAPSSSAFTIGALLVSGVTEWQGCCPVNVQTNSLSQVRIRFSTSNGSYIIITLGWTDNLN